MRYAIPCAVLHISRIGNYAAKIIERNTSLKREIELKDLWIRSSSCYEWTTRTYDKFSYNRQKRNTLNVQEITTRFFTFDIQFPSSLWGSTELQKLFGVRPLKNYNKGLGFVHKTTFSNRPSSQKWIRPPLSNVIFICISTRETYS